MLPKKHWASFRETSPAAVRDVALALQSAMQRMKKYVNDPDLNFFIHDTPLDHKDYRHHHWHIEVIPRTSFEAGFEFSTRIDINVVDPDNAAAILRGKGKKAAARTNCSMIEKIKKYRLVSLLFACVARVRRGRILLGARRVGGMASGPLILHFNDMHGDHEHRELWPTSGMGVLGIAIVVINFFSRSSSRRGTMFWERSSP